MEEVKKIKAIFKANAYPEHFTNEIIVEFTNRKDNQQKEDNAHQTINKCFFVLPYVGKASEKLQKTIRKRMQLYNIQVLPAYRTVKVGSYMCLKTAIPPLFKSDVVYKFQCPCDKDIQYIGETQRQFFRRISDHVSCSATKTPTAVYNHILNCNSCTTSTNYVDCFSLLRNTKHVLSEEALCIKKYRPSLNLQMGPYKGSRVPTRIFN